MGRGRGGGGGGGKAGLGGWMSRSRLFRALKLGGPSRYQSDMLKQVAIARGLRNVEELLASLGKQDTDISMEEALDLMTQELGDRAVTNYLLADYYSGRKGSKRCELLLKTYQENVKRYGEGYVAPQIHVYALRNICGYHIKEEGGVGWF